MTEQHKKRRYFLISATVLTLCFIWGNSLLPSSVSAEISDGINHFLNTIFKNAIVTQGLTSDEGALRKIAHATEFAVLSLEFYLLIIRIRKKGLPLYFLSGLFVALIDETIQLFISGRAGQVKDVWIDFSGFCFTFIVISIFHILRRRRKKSDNI